MNRFVLAAAAALFAGLGLLAVPAARAADHGDAPNMDNDTGADIADVFFFLDPSDNTKAIIIGTVHGFIVPGEAGNFAAFDPNVTYRFEIENTGDAKPDNLIEVTFSERTAPTAAQTASIRLPSQKKPTFSAPTTPATLGATANDQVITTDQASGIKFFAGEVDDPFFFDIPAFQRFVASVLGNAPDATAFNRGRDTFAGYNALGIAFSIPVALIKGAADNTTIGVDFVTARKNESIGKNGVIKASGKAKQKDRMGNPAVNVALIPFDRKNEYNSATPVDDAKNRFTDSIVATLNALGTSDANKAILARVAITNGDYLHLDLTKPNAGTNPEAGFPNGRRLTDDVIDTLLSIITNGLITTGDNVNASDVPPQTVFPFLAKPQQPRDAGVVDDNTRN